MSSPNNNGIASFLAVRQLSLFMLLYTTGEFYKLD